MKLVILETGDSGLYYFPHVFSSSTMQAVLQEVQWKQNTIRVYGKDYLEPRLTAWSGPPYRYSNVQWPDQPLLPIFHQMIQKIQSIWPADSNSVLLNYYRSGQDSMGWHRDNEPEMDTRIIASVSFGETRKFKVRHRGESGSLDIPLSDGSLLIMKNMQEEWEHSLPKTKRSGLPRLNLTFRKIKVDSYR